MFYNGTLKRCACAQVIEHLYSKTNLAKTAGAHLLKDITKQDVSSPGKEKTTEK